MQLDIANPKLSEIEALGINAENVYFNLSATELTEATLNINEGTVTNSGALSIKTGKFTPVLEAVFLCSADMAVNSPDHCSCCCLSLLTP